MKGLQITAVMLLALAMPLVASAKPTNQKTQAVSKPVPATSLQAINLRANKVISFYAQQSPQFGKNEESVKALEQIANLHLLRPQSAKATNDFIQSYGAFYGQTLIHLFGGKWVYFNGGLAVKNKNGIVAYPYASVRNRLTNNKPNSIYREMQVYKQLSQMTSAQISQSLKKK